jgi:hypothetical protein
VEEVENVGISEMMFDGQNYAAGCIRINGIMGAVIGPQNYYLGFNNYGLLVNAGHEVQVQNSWFGEYLYTDPRKEKGNAVGIFINGNDHVVNNVVVFSSRIGIEVYGAANLIFNAHTWNCANENGGIGIYMSSSGYTQNRVVSSYLDYNDLVVDNPEHLVISECFFLGGGGIVIKATSNYVINGLSIINNEFDVPYSDYKYPIMVNETLFNFTGIVDTFIESNMVTSGFVTRSTTARFAISQSNARDYCADLRDVLLFAQFPFNSIQYSVRADDPTNPPVIQYISTDMPFEDVSDNRGICIHLEGARNQPVSATVFIEVDQSKHSSETNIVKSSVPFSRKSPPILARF